MIFQTNIVTLFQFPPLQIHQFQLFISLFIFSFNFHFSSYQRLCFFFFPFDIHFKYYSSFYLHFTQIGKCIIFLLKYQPWSNCIPTETMKCYALTFSDRQQNFQYHWNLLNFFLFEGKRRYFARQSNGNETHLAINRWLRVRQKIATWSIVRKWSGFNFLYGPRRTTHTK